MHRSEVQIWRQTNPSCFDSRKKVKDYFLTICLLAKSNSFEAGRCLRNESDFTKTISCFVVFFLSWSASPWARVTLKCPAVEDVPYTKPHHISLCVRSQVDPQFQRVMRCLQAETQCFLFTALWRGADVKIKGKTRKHIFQYNNFREACFTNVCVISHNLRLQVTCVSQNVQGRGKVFRKGEVQPIGRQN